MRQEQEANLWRASDAGAPDFPPLDGDLAADLAVIGGGFTGCAAALEAARSGARVAVLEAQTIGHGGSGRNVGLVNAGLWLPPARIAARLGETAGSRLIEALSAAPDEVFALVEAHGIDCEATRNGTLHLAHSPKGLADLRERHRQGRAVGAPVELLDRAETRRRTGSEAFHGALLDPRAGTIQPLGYCRGLARAAASAGAALFERSPASGLRHDGDDWIVSCNRRCLRARRLLLATNAYVGALPGTPTPAFVPFHFFQFATPPLPAEMRADILPGGEGCWDTAMVMTSLRVDKAGRVVIGAIGRLSGPGGGIHRNWAARKLARVYPALAGIGFAHEWEGRIASTSDHIPRVVQFGPGALSVFGYSGRGIGPGTVFGRRAARALLFGETGGLPLEISARHSEALRRLRAGVYEAGATMAHMPRP